MPAMLESDPIILHLFKADQMLTALKEGVHYIEHAPTSTEALLVMSGDSASILEIPVESLLPRVT